MPVLDLIEPEACATARPRSPVPVSLGELQRRYGPRPQSWPRPRPPIVVVSLTELQRRSRDLVYESLLGATVVLVDARSGIVMAALTSHLTPEVRDALISDGRWMVPSE